MKHNILKSIAAFALMLAMLMAVSVPALAAQKTSRDFFQENGSTQAVQILDTAKQKGKTKLGSDTDATSLKNMYKSLETIDKTNEYRAKEGLPALKVSDSYMAMAQINANYCADYYKNRKQLNHNQEFINQYSVLENLAWAGTPDRGVEMWYSEKSQNGGHYTTMMGRNSGINSNLTGAAINSNNAGGYNNLFISETFGVTSLDEQTYTVAQYRDRLANYMQANGISVD